jgi:hypothetical protein
VFGFEACGDPVECDDVGYFAFQGCSGLTHLKLPSSFSCLGGDVFVGVTKLEHLTLLGSALSPSVVANLERCLTSTATVKCPALVGRKFGSFTIAT